MPKSSRQGKDVALKWYEQLKPKTVVDVGPGIGTYSILMRPAHRAHWVGVEVWEPYVNQFSLNDLYDEIVVADARYVDPATYESDLVIAGDIIEHMDKDDGKGLIASIKKRTKNFFVSIPIRHYPQGPWQGNPYEEHVSHWDFDEMKRVLGRGVAKTWKGKTLGYFWWKR